MFHAEAHVNNHSQSLINVLKEKKYSDWPFKDKLTDHLVIVCGQQMKAELLS